MTRASHLQKNHQSAAKASNNTPRIRTRSAPAPCFVSAIPIRAANPDEPQEAPRTRGREEQPKRSQNEVEGIAEMTRSMERSETDEAVARAPCAEQPGVVLPVIVVGVDCPTPSIARLVCTPRWSEAA